MLMRQVHLHPLALPKFTPQHRLVAATKLGSITTHWACEKTHRSIFLSDLFTSFHFAHISITGKILTIHHPHQAARDMRIFVSYSSKNREHTQGLIDDLEGLG